MIQLISIANSLNINPELRPIYEEAFPRDERREWNQLLELISNPKFSLKAVYSENKLIGFISQWNLDKFCFIEHFAISENERGKGFGSMVIKQIQNDYLTPIILEVEKPLTNAAIRRITFYKQLNFKVLNGSYYQPPYSIEKNKVKMVLMSYSNTIMKQNFKEVKIKIHQTVYNYSE